jgi:hypothetical protein
MRLTLVVPALADAPADAQSRFPALARIAAYGSAAATALDVDTALLEAAGASTETPVAPLAALGAGFDPGSDYVLRADPVAFVAGRDDVLLAGRVDDLSPEETHVLIDVLNRHFEPDGLAFRAARPDAWFVAARANVPVETSPLSAVQGPIQPHLPHGDNAKAWRRWLSEMQMLLHDHPVNAKREAAGRALVTAIWISGGGVARHDVKLPRRLIVAPEGPAGDVARGLAMRSDSVAGRTPASLGALAANVDALAVLPAATDEDSLAALARDWLDPAVAALERGDVGQLDVLIGHGGLMSRWSAAKPSSWRRLRARLSRS